MNWILGNTKELLILLSVVSSDNGTVVSSVKTLSFRAIYRSIRMK